MNVFNLSLEPLQSKLYLINRRSRVFLNHQMLPKAFEFLHLVLYRSHNQHTKWYTVALYFSQMTKYLIKGKIIFSAANKALGKTTHRLQYYCKFCWSNLSLPPWEDTQWKLYQRSFCLCNLMFVIVTFTVRFWMIFLCVESW